MEGEFEGKVKRKHLKYINILRNDYGLVANSEKTKNLMICNAGLVNGIQREDVVNFFKEYGVVESVVMLINKSYSFVIFKDLKSAEDCYLTVNGNRTIPGMNGPLYLLYVNQVPDFRSSQDFTSWPPGVIVIENFISEAEEVVLAECVNIVEDGTASSMKNRQVKHYGYEFCYDTNNVNKEQPLKEDVPKECDFLLERLGQKGYPNLLLKKPNQLTVNYYLPGQGIPPHVDTHSAFEDIILSLSLGSDIVMDFKNDEGRHLCVLLPSRSLLIMSGEARYSWTHGITPRKTDIVMKTEEGLTVQERGPRTSFTFRCIRKGNCNCDFPDCCDSQINNILDVSDEVAKKLENTYVHEVYEQISSHFSRTRHTPWPEVLSFIQKFPVGSVIIDVGCGNGKYFGFHAGMFEVGCDYSQKLAKECKDRNFETTVCSCLALPFKSEVADGVISIAVIHHLATEARRIKAIREILRVMKPKGRALIYVWAKDQCKNNIRSKYLKKTGKRQVGGVVPCGIQTRVLKCELSPNCFENDAIGLEKDEVPISQDNFQDAPSNCNRIITAVDPPKDVALPVHTNRTLFKQQDLLVPWKMKSDEPGNDSSSTFLRFYHVFEENELKRLCQSEKEAQILSSYYDQGNWCILLEKKIQEVDSLPN